MSDKKETRVPLFSTVDPETKRIVDAIAESSGDSKGVIVDKAVALLTGGKVKAAPNRKNLVEISADMRRLNKRLSDELK